MRRPFGLDCGFGAFGKGKRTSPSDSTSSQNSYKQEPQENLNGACAATYTTPNSWSDCSSYGAYSPSNFYEPPHQDVASMHISSVLPEATSTTTEFLNTSLTRNSPPPFASGKDLMESSLTSRSYQDSPYCPNSWGTSFHSNNNYYQTTPYNSQHFNPPTPVYPAIISTVNQHQIHFHLHPPSSTDRTNQDTTGYFLGDNLNATEVRNDLVPTTVSEVGSAAEHGVPEGSREESTVQDTNVWRPY